MSKTFLFCFCFVCGLQSNSFWSQKFCTCVSMLVLSNFVKNTPLRVVFSTLFSVTVFGNAMKHCIAFDVLLTGVNSRFNIPPWWIPDRPFSNLQLPLTTMTTYSPRMKLNYPNANVVLHYLTVCIVAVMTSRSHAGLPTNFLKWLFSTIYTSSIDKH